MLFWLICGVLTLAIIATVALPLLRPPGGAMGTQSVDLYRDQLAEVDRDIARGVLDTADAERTKIEIARRLLAASEDVTFAAPQTPSRIGAIGAGALLIAVAGGVYSQLGAPGYPDLPLSARIENGNVARETRPSQAQAEAAAPTMAAVDAPDEYLASVAQLRELVPNRPDDIEGWQLLARHEAELRNFGAAAIAQGHVVRLLADAATPLDRMREVDLLVAAANGFVSKQSEIITREVLQIDDGNIAARYYLGALYDQTDRPDIAVRLWRDLVELGPTGGFHAAFARSQIEQAAFRAGIEYTLPPERGPTAQDIENAGDLSTADRQAMIGDMVARLSDRLASEGGAATEWARLISAYGVLGDAENARAIWTEAQDVFGASESAMAILRPAAQSAGVLE